MSTASRTKFWSRLRSLGYSTYGDYLRSEHWADLRGRYFASRLWRGRCTGCGTETGPFQVHHRTYKRLGAEWLMDVTGVCRRCHERIHSNEPKASAKASLWSVTKRTLKREAKKGQTRRKEAERGRRRVQSGSSSSSSSSSGSGSSSVMSSVP